MPSDMHGLVADDAFVADPDAQGVEENQGIDRLQRPCLPGGNLFQDRTGECAGAC